MGAKKSTFFAACVACSWFEPHLTRADAFDAQASHDAAHVIPPAPTWLLSDYDRKLLNLYKIGASEDSE